MTEGEDKPAKYPLLFREARAVIVTKTDLLPHVPMRLEGLMGHLRKIHDGVPVFQVCALRGEGIEPWVSWVLEQRGRMAAQRERKP